MRRKLFSSFLVVATLVLAGWGAHTLYGTRVSASTEPIVGTDGSLPAAIVKRGDVAIMFGRLNPNEEHDRGPLGRGVALYTTVADEEDIDALFAHARASGAQVVQEPMDQFWGHRDWTVADPDGYRIIVSKVIRAVSAEEMQEAALAGAPAD